MISHLSRSVSKRLLTSSLSSSTLSTISGQNMSCFDFEEFPFSALLPKKETQASSFLAKYPNYDGRGVKIAIFDSGVDPGAPGLSVTSTGQPKIIDMMDATGAGDVDTSTIVEADSEGFITGLTKRKLKIPSEWKNPTGKYHIGVKNVYELFPKSVRSRVKKEYFDKEFLPKHKPLMAETIQKYEDFKRKHPENETIDNLKERLQVILEKEELKSQVDIMKSVHSKLSDLGPTFDCVVFHDGEHWKACIDTSGEGDLEKCTLLGNYRECLKFGTISDKDKYNYGVNIYDDGNILEIVGQCSSHGTHVASIASACFPEDPDRNGVAPGAQLVTIVIGDNRLGTMETGSGIVRAFIKAIESGCDIINMSYGESAHWIQGRLPELILDLVHKHGLIYCSSAGNSGPALDTIGAPAYMDDTIISVGAYVTPEMMLAEYSMREKLPASAYSWSSRGPTIEGGVGVSLCAPGGAITSVPNWTLKSGVLMNGTSMASPNACGCITLLLSAMKQRQIIYTPYSIRMSLENTALKVPNYEPLTHGNGLIQVEKAYEHLINYSADPSKKLLKERDILFEIRCNTQDHSGIYLRELEQVRKPSIHVVTVTPLLFKDENQDEKINFEMNFNFTCDASWVQCPKYFNLTYGPRSFQVRIDPSSLVDGTVNETFIKAYDVNCCEKGPSFKIPITVIKPMVVENDKFKFNEIFKPGFFKRVFLDVPLNATSAMLKITNNHPNEVGKFVLHCRQKPSQKSFSGHTYFQHLAINPQSDVTYSFDVIGGITMELCFGKWWSCSIDADVTLEIEFDKINLENSNQLGIVASNCITRFDIRNYGTQAVVINPSLKLNEFVHSVKPNESKIKPLGARDVWPEGKVIYELILTYSLKLNKNTECTILFPLLCSTLYESPYESQMWMLFDSNKQYLACGDAYPTKYFTKLDKGEYKILLQIRHDSLRQLEHVQELPIQVLHQLRDPISLPIYHSHYNAIEGQDKKASNVKFFPNLTTPLFASTMSNGQCFPSLKQLPVKVLGIFRGNLLLTKVNAGNSNAKHKSNNFKVEVFIDCDPKTKSNDTESKEEKDLIEHKLGLISKLDKLADQYLKDLESDGDVSSDIRFTMAKLQNRYQEPIKDPHKDNEVNIDDKSCSKEQELIGQIDLANKIINEIGLDDFIQNFSKYKMDSKKLSHSPAEVKQIERNKYILIDSLIIKGVQLCRLIKHRKAHHKNLEIPQKFYDDIEDIYAKLSLFSENLNDPKMLSFVEKHALLHGHYARYIKVILKESENDSVGGSGSSSNNGDSIDVFKASHSDMDYKIGQAFNRLGWNHMAKHLERQKHVKFPGSYRKF